MICKLYHLFNNRSCRFKKSLTISATIIGSLATLLTILGISLSTFPELTIVTRILIVVSVFLLLFVASYVAIGIVFRNSIDLSIHGTHVAVRRGNIFDAQALRVIGCDTHFDTRIDDIVISKSSLHGKLFLKHGDTKEIENLVSAEAKRLNLSQNEDGTFEFPLGTIVVYESSVDNQTYLLLAMTKLDSDYEAHTNMAEFEQMLMHMWKEIDRTYAGRSVALPVLGAGITRFDDRPKRKEDLLRCMMCTLNSSSVALSSRIDILIFEDASGVPLYELKSAFHSLPRR